MGSVQPFPGKHGAATIADVWRSGAAPGTGRLRIRTARIEDFASIHALQRRVAPALPATTLRQFEMQRHAFPAGQLVAEMDGFLLGLAASLMVQWDEYSAAQTWSAVTADGTFATHDPGGRTLYGAELLVDSSRHGFGAGRALCRARRRLCHELNLRRIIAPVRLAGYAALGGSLTPEAYAMRVVWGDIPDALLRFQISQGFQYCGIARGYRPEDLESAGHAALIAWLNPIYSPPRPPALEAERHRRCA